MEELEKIAVKMNAEKKKAQAKKPKTGPQNTQEWLEEGVKEGRGSGFGRKIYGI